MQEPNHGEIEIHDVLYGLRVYSLVYANHNPRCVCEPPARKPPAVHLGVEYHASQRNRCNDPRAYLKKRLAHVDFFFE